MSDTIPALPDKTMAGGGITIPPLPPVVKTNTRTIPALPPIVNTAPTTSVPSLPPVTTPIQEKSKLDLTKIDWSTLKAAQDAVVTNPTMRQLINDPQYQAGVATATAEQNMAKLFGLPLEMVTSNLPAVSQAIYGQKVDPPGIVQRVINTVKGIHGDFRIGELGARAFLGDDSVLPQIKELQAEQPKPEEMLGGFGKAVLGMLVGMGYQVKSGIEGTLVGAAASMIGGMILGPGGMVAGIAAGVYVPAREQLDHLTGSQYVAMIDSGMDPTAARVAAGALSVGLEALNFAKIGNLPGVKKLAEEAVVEGTKRALLNGSFAKIAGDFLKRATVSTTTGMALPGAVTTQGLLTLAGAVGNTTLIEAAKWLETKIDGKTFTHENFLDILAGWGLQTATGTAVGFVMAAPGLIGENLTIKTELARVVREAAPKPTPEPVVAPKPGEPVKPKPYVPPAPGEQKIGDIIAMTDAQAAKFNADIRSAESSADYIQTEDVPVKQAVTIAVDEMKAKLEARDLTKKYITDIAAVDTTQMRPEFAEPVQKIMDNYTVENFNKNTTAKLNDLRNQLEANPELGLSSDSMRKLGELDKTPLKSLSVEDLKTIRDAITHYAKLQRDTHSINVGIRKVDTQVAAEQVIKEMPKVETFLPLKEGEVRIAKTGQTAMEKMAEGIDNGIQLMVTTGQEFPDFIAQKIGPMYKEIIINPIKDGVYKKDQYKISVASNFRTQTESVHQAVGDIHKWLSEISVANVKNDVGESTILSLNRGERLAMYMHSLNPENKAHLLDGGFGLRFAGEKNRDLVFKIDEAELNRIADSVRNDPHEKTYVDAVASALSKMGKDQAAIYLDINDVPLELMDAYYHIDTMPVARGSDADTEALSTQAKADVVRIGQDKGHLKARTDSEIPIYLNSITHDLAVSTEHAASYVNLEKPLLNASRLHYRPEVKSALNKSTGTKTWRVMDKFLRDAASMNNPVADLYMSLFDKVRTNMATSLMGAPNLFIPLKQPGAFLRYSNEISPQYLLKGLYASIQEAGQSEKFLQSTSMLYATRRLTGTNREMAEVLRRGQVEAGLGGKISLVQKAMSPISWADTRGSVRPGMMGAVMQVVDEFKSGNIRPRTAELVNIDIAKLKAMINPDDQIKIAVKFAERVTEMTQTSGNPALLTDFQRGNTLEKYLSLFQSEGVVGTNMRRRAFFEAQKENSAKGWGKFTRIMLLSLLAEPFFETVVDRARRAFTGQKQPGLLPDYASHVSRQVFGGLPVTRDIAGQVANKSLLGWNYQNQGLTPVDNLANAATVVITDLLNPANYTSTQKAYAMAKGIGDLVGLMSGLPITPVFRMSEGAVNIVKKVAQ